MSGILLNSQNIPPAFPQVKTRKPERRHQRLPIKSYLRETQKKTYIEENIDSGDTEQTNLAIPKTFLKEKRGVGMGHSVGGHTLASLSPSADV